MYGHHIYSRKRRIDRAGKVANPARGQLNRENENSLSAFVPENMISRDGFGSPVPRQPAHLHTQAESGAYLRDSSRVPRRRPFIYFKPYTVYVSSEFYVFLCISLTADGPQRARLSIPLTATLLSCLWSRRFFPSLPGSRLTNFIAIQVQHSYNLSTNGLQYSYVCMVITDTVEREGSSARVRLSILLVVS